MPNPPQLSGAELIRRLERLGFVKIHGKGGHAVMEHPTTKTRTTVPCHGSRDINRNTMRAILKQCKLTVEEIRDA